MQVAAAQNSGTRAAPANAVASTIARPDPDAVAAQKLQAAKDAAATLKQAKSSQNDTTKAQAKQAVEQLRERIKMLRMMCAGDPKALAKMVASLSKELAAAVKQYAAAGGTETVSTEVAPADSSAATPASADKPSAEDASAASDTPSADAESAAAPQAADKSAAPQSPEAAQKTDAYQKMVAGLEKQSQLLSAKSAEAKDTNDFMKEVRGLANQLKTYLKHATAHMDKAQQATNPDAADAEKALKEIDKTINDAAASSNALTAVGGSVNVSA